MASILGFSGRFEFILFLFGDGGFGSLLGSLKFLGVFGFRVLEWSLESCYRVSLLCPGVVWLALFLCSGMASSLGHLLHIGD